MKRYFFYIAVIAAVALSAAVSSFTTHARDNGKPSAASPSSAEAHVSEVSPADPAPTAVDRPVVIDFYAAWCGPCKTYRPVFDRVAKDYAKKATFLRVDIDKCRDLAAQYRISGIPTTIILTPGGKTYKSVGYISEAQLRRDLDTALR